MTEQEKLDNAIHRLDVSVSWASDWLSNDEHPHAHMWATDACIDALRAASHALKDIQSILASQGSATAQMIRDARNGLPIE